MRALRFRSAIVTTAVACAVIIASCGEADNGPSGETTVRVSSLSKAEFLRRARAGCAREARGLLVKAGKFTAEKEREGVPQQVLFAQGAKAILVPLVEARMAVMRKLGAPAADKEKIEAILSSEQRSIEEVKELERASSGEVAEDLFTESIEKLRAYGLVACSAAL